MHKRDSHLVTEDSVCRTGTFDQPVQTKRAERTVTMTNFDNFEMRKQQLEDCICDWNYIKNHVFLCVQKQNTGDILKKHYLNFEVCMKVLLPSDEREARISLTVTESFRKSMGVMEAKLWKIADLNTKYRFRTRKLSEMFPFPFDDESGLYVVTTETGWDGVTALLFNEVFHQFCLEHEILECYILPSSTHEVLVLGENDVSEEQLQTLPQMVRDINASCVDEEIQMDPVVYRYNLMEDRIVIAAEV